MAEDLLDVLLSAASDEIAKSENINPRLLTETNLFAKEANGERRGAEANSTDLHGSKEKLSVIHSGDTDSSDDEDNKYYTEQRYNECGKGIRHLQQTDSSTSNNSSQLSSWTSKLKPEQPTVKSVLKIQGNVDTDPIFGIRIVNPVISFTTLQDRMIGREAITFLHIKKFIMGNIADKNWVIGGVIVTKSSVKTSQKGNQFLIWDLSDLKNDIKMVSVFLFGSAYKQLWKTTTGTVVGILNPSVFDKKDSSRHEATLSVDNPQKVMILGRSKDLGTCKSSKKNGEPCNAIVNINQCQYCIYHLKQAYQKCSQRSELQSSFAGKGLTALQNKVLGKNEVFYAGKLYMAIPAKRSGKLQEKDKNRLDTLSSLGGRHDGSVKVKNTVRKAATNLEITHHQRLRDFTLLEKLGGKDVQTPFNASLSTEITLHDAKQSAVSVISKLKAKSSGVNCNTQDVATATANAISVPVLTGKEKGMIDLTGATTRRNKAKLNAVKYVQKNGPLKKIDPNNVKTQSTNKKRIAEKIESAESDSKRQKLEESVFVSDRFKKLMAATSKHADLLEIRDNEEQEKYFYKLEVKEKMEEKMINTFKVPCKAVRCLKCNYTNFSASQLCKDDKHPLKVFDAIKRFFKCGKCGNRIQSLDVVPVSMCKNCSSVKWEKTGMMKDKAITITPQLSIRGGEQKFVNSAITGANLDLLMPDEEL